MNLIFPRAEIGQWIEMRGLHPVLFREPDLIPSKKAMVQQ